MNRKRVFWLVISISAMAGAWMLYVAIQSSHLLEPEVQVKNENYVETRKHFQTSLLREDVSPQREVFALHRPDYVDEVEFPSGALRLKAWIAGRETAQKLPAVLFLHGGFEFGSADWDMAAPYWQAGFILMVPMLRGENGQQGTFSFLYNEVDDVLAAAEYLSQQPAVDPAHIFLAGHSSGATLALLAIEASDRFKAAASFDASPDQQLLYNGSGSKTGHHPEIVFDHKDLRELQVRSPLAYVLSVKSPVRLFFSHEAAPIAQRPSQRFAELVRAHGMDADSIRVRGSHMSHVAQAMPRSIQFFKEYLGPQANVLRSRKVPPLSPSLVGNTTFRLKGHDGARVVALAGSFNGWNSQHYLCGKENGDWICRVDLPAGRYHYQFVVDEQWINDPANPLLEQSGNGGMASVIEKP